MVFLLVSAVFVSDYLSEKVAVKKMKDVAY